MRLIPVIAVGWVLAGGTAHAWSSPLEFDVSAANGGGAGVYFTGSPRFSGQHCGHCHVGGDDSVRVRLSATPEALFGRPYTPGQVYRIQVDLIEDRRGPESCDGGGRESRDESCNLNLFAVGSEGEGGRPVGMLCPDAPADGGCTSGLGRPTVRSRDGTVLFANGLAFDPDGRPRYRDREVLYDFYWQAPATDVGPVSFWIGAVDGDGAQGDPSRPTDPDGDAYGVFRLRACAPSGCAPSADESFLGCSSAPLNATPAWPVGAGLSLITLLWTIRRWRCRID